MSFSESDMSLQIGDTFKVAIKTNLRSLSLASFHFYIGNPIKLGQIAFVKNDFGIPFAFATWAYITQDVATELANNPSKLLHLSEWNEGTIICFMDFVSIKGKSLELVKNVKTAIRAKLKSKSSDVMWIRYNEDGTIKKIVRFSNYG